MLLDGRDRKRVDWASELDLGSVSSRHVTTSMSLGTLVGDGGGLDAVGDGGGGARRRAAAGTTTGTLLRHAGDLLASSGVRPELVVEFLRRRGVVGDGTAAAVGRCVGRRRAACELVAEVVVVGRVEVEALCDGLRATGCADAADCLAAVDELLRLTTSTDSAGTERFDCTLSVTPSSIIVGNSLPE